MSSVPGTVAFGSHLKPSSTAIESKYESPTSHTTMRRVTMSPGMTLPLVVSQKLPPRSSKPVPASWPLPSEHDFELT